MKSFEEGKDKKTLCLCSNRIFTGKRLKKQLSRRCVAKIRQFPSKVELSFNHPICGMILAEIKTVALLSEEDSERTCRIPTYSSLDFTSTRKLANYQPNEFTKKSISYFSN